MSDPALAALHEKGWRSNITDRNNRVWYSRPDGSSVHTARDLRVDEGGLGPVLFPGRGKKRPLIAASPAVPLIPPQSPCIPGPDTGAGPSSGVPHVATEVEVTTEVRHIFLSQS